MIYTEPPMTNKYGLRRALLNLLVILFYIGVGLMLLYSVYGANTAKINSHEITAEQQYTAQLEYRIQQLENENRQLRQDVAILYNINNLGEYVPPKEE